MNTYKCKQNVKFQTTTSQDTVNKELLQKRLKTVSAVLLFAVTIFSIRGTYIKDPTMILQLATFCILVFSTVALMWKQHSIKFIRTLEISIFTIIVVFLVTKYLTIIINMSRAGQFSEANIHQVYLCSALVNIMILYGLFLPNHWRRTLAFASITTAAYFIPVIIINYSYESLRIINLWAVSHFIVGIVVACSGSFVIHSLRKEVLDAESFGSYKTTKQIASDGMGEIWEAQHKMLARPAAVKIIRPDMASASEDTIIRFEREVEAIAKLDSPHTVQIYDFGTTNVGKFYYAMELLEGVDLDHLVDHYGPLCIPRGVYILEQICKSLMEAHNKGLVHRDIKPANIFLCQRGCEYDFIKVLDFGMVKREWDLQKITQENIINGTPTFIAPEMLEDSGKIDERTDIYLFGCVAYWLFTGRFVFLKNNILTTIMAHINEQPLRISSIVESFPQSLENMIMKCLEKKPSDRPSHIKDIYLCLEKTGYSQQWSNQQAETWWHKNMLDSDSLRYW